MTIVGDTESGLSLVRIDFFVKIASPILSVISPFISKWWKVSASYSVFNNGWTVFQKIVALSVLVFNLPARDFKTMLNSFWLSIKLYRIANWRLVKCNHRLELNFSSNRFRAISVSCMTSVLITRLTWNKLSLNNSGRVSRRLIPSFLSLLITARVFSPG